MRKMPRNSRGTFRHSTSVILRESLSHQKKTVICSETNSGFSFSVSAPYGKFCCFVQSVKSSFRLMRIPFIHLLIYLH